MLVTLATNQTIAANSSATYTYSPNSLQKVFINIEDADWDDVKVTVQLGSTTICNGAQMFGLAGLSALQSSVAIVHSGATGFASLDFGSHVANQNDNVYVTLAASGEATAVDVSCLVDEPGVNMPVKITEYSDNTFTSNNNLFGFCFQAAKSQIDEDTTPVQIRTAIDSSAPTVVSSSSWYKSRTYSADERTAFGILNSHQVPLKTTYNYVTGGTMDRILTIEQMPTSRQQNAQARQSARIALSQAGK